MCSNVQLNTDALIEYSRALKAQLKSQKLVSPYLEPPLRWLPRPPPSAKAAHSQPRRPLRGSRAFSARTESQSRTRGSTRETSRERPPAQAKRPGARDEEGSAIVEDDEKQQKGQRKGKKKQEKELPEDPITLLPTVSHLFCF